MHYKKPFLFSLGIFLLFSSTIRGQKINPGTRDFQFWLTDPEQGIYFQPIKEVEPPTLLESSLPKILVNPLDNFQTMEGFGFALTGGSAGLLMKMEPQTRKTILQEFFGHGPKDIGVSYIRISIGSSDLDDHVFSYDDLAPGEKDINLVHFSMGPDLKALIPVLKEILTINPKIQILASPWSPPAWMKTNDSTIGGHLKKEYYSVYARYLIHYLKTMKAMGVPIKSMTLQNEPLNPGNNPSMVMEPEEQKDFLKENMGPGLLDSGLKTEILLYDHNADRPDYPISILEDETARKYATGSAFHLYGGDISALSKVHEAFPFKGVYFTEQWVGSPENMMENLRFHIPEVLIGSTRNWAKVVLEWNLASDPNQNPHTPGGCDRCLGAITLDGDIVKRNSAYYIIAHASKFVPPGSKRIESNLVADLPNVAFLTPEGQKVLIVYNARASLQRFQIVSQSKIRISHLNPGSVGTYVW